MNNPFRFSLRPGDETGESKLCGPDEFFRILLQELLDLLVPVEKDREVHVDGYKMLNDRQTAIPLYPKDSRPALLPSDPLDLYEPRISYIRDLIDRITQMVDLEAGGRKIAIDGFRLKNPGQWITRGNASDILAHAASRCNLDCRFCYNRNTSPVLQNINRTPEEELSEIKARIDLYRPEAGVGIFPNMRSPAEALAHPYFFDILSQLRIKTKEPLRFSTNGSLLTGRAIDRLASHRPLFLDVSLNSSSPDRRRWLMNDPNPEIAMDALRRLKKARIPYGVVIVPWPEPSIDAMIADLQHTIAFTVDFDPALIQISLPGCARGTGGKHLFCHEQVWENIKNTILSLRTTTEIPLVLRPGFFEEYREPDKLNTPLIIGSIKNSPASRSGICSGDIIQKINGLPVKSRHQARSLLTILHQSDLKSASLLIHRNGSQVEVQLDLKHVDYPYSAETSTHLGAVFPSSGFPREWFEKLADEIASHDATDVLLLTSTLVKPTLEKYLPTSGIGSAVRLHIRVPKNDYFGGNILMGDLLVTSDFIACIREFIDKENLRPGLVLIPASPFHISGWSRDLTAKVYLEIERETGLPVALVECDPIFD